MAPGRPRSNTIGALDIDLGLPPQRPVVRPSKADNLPPSFELPPTSFRKKGGIDSKSKLDRRIEKRASAVNPSTRFDPMLSSSAPTDMSALLNAMGRERGFGMPSFMGNDNGEDIEMDLKIDGEDSFAGSSSSTHSDNSAAHSESDSDSAESELEDDDDDFVYKTKGNLAKDFSYHYSFRAQVAEPVATREEDINSSSDEFDDEKDSLHEYNAKKSGHFQSLNDKKSFHQFEDESEDDNSSYSSDDDVPVSASFKAQGKAPLFTTSPLLNATLEKLRDIDPFNRDGDEFDDPPEFTLDVS